MGTANGGGFGQGFSGGSPPTGIMDALQKFMPAGMQMPSALTNKMSKMGGAQTPPNHGLPSLAGVPSADSIPGANFNQAQDPAARQALLQAMIAKSRGGAPTGTMTPQPAGVPAGQVVIK